MSTVELATADREDGSIVGPVLPSPSGAPRDRGLGAVGWVRGHPLVVVLALALAAGVWAVAGSHHVFRYLSDDHDEGLYLLQADALAEGHLFPPAPEQPDAFTPWLSVLRDGKYVLKYAPVHASILALGVALGSARWSLGLIAAAVVVMTYALAREVLGDRRLAVLAAAFLALSPLFLVQSATFLPYCSSLLVLEGFVFTLLRGVRTRRGPVLAVSGFLFGVSLFGRPFDALLFGAPIGLYVLVRGRHRPASLGRQAAWFAAGTVLPVVAMLLYYRAATGSPFRPPFNLLEPSDTIGFGPRRLLPGHPELAFTPALGWRGVTRHALLTSFWGFGGLLLVGCFAVGVLRRRRGGPEGWVALAGLTFAAGYAFFWGTYGTALRGSLTSFLGPFYFLPVLACVTLLAARGFGELWRRDRLMTGLTAAAMVAVSGYLLAAAFDVNQRLTDEDRRLYTPLAAADLDGALVLVPPTWGPHLLHPFAWLRNDADYDGETVFALDRGEPANLALAGAYPGRDLFRLRVHGRYRSDPPDPGLTTSLERLRLVERPALATRLSLRNATGAPNVAVTVEVGRRRHTFVLDTSSGPGSSYDGTLRIGAGAVEWDGPVEAHRTEPVAPGGALSVSVAVGERTVYHRQFGYAAAGPALRVLLPGVVSVHELGDDLTVEVEGWAAHE